MHVSKKCVSKLFAKISYDWISKVYLKNLIRFHAAISVWFSFFYFLINIHFFPFSSIPPTFNIFY